MENPKQPRKTILITCWSLTARTGSELHTLSLALAFQAKGWDVTCFTILHGYPLQGEFSKHGIKVIDFMRLNQLSGHFDVLYAQHCPVAELVWNLSDISFSKVFIGILGIGTKTSLERLPSFARFASGIVFVSEESKRDAMHSGNIAGVPCMLFPNYASKDYFTVQQRDYPESPNKIAVISNNPPQELIDFQQDYSSTLDIDIFGLGTTSIEITPELLRKYDLIISIGKTAQYCFAAGAPYYCYDRHGGPGYIQPEDEELHAWYNFSGRSTKEKKTSEELYRDILSGYNIAKSNLGQLRHIAQRRFDFSSLFERLIRFIAEKKENPCLYGDNRPTSTSKLQDNISEGMKYWSSEMPLYGFATVRPKGDDDRLVSFQYRYSTSITLDFCDLLPGHDGSILFSPDSSGCECTLKGCEVLSSNAITQLTMRREADVFLAGQPLYELTAHDKITFEVRPVPYHELTELIHKYEMLAREEENPSIRHSFKQLLRAVQRRFFRKLN